MATTTPWLPQTAPDDIAERLARIARQWRARWFVRAAGGRVEARRSVELGEWTWRGDDECAVGAAPGRLTALGLGLLDGEADADNTRDRELLDRIGEAALEDLAVALARVAGGGGAGAACAAPAGDAERYLFDKDGEAPIVFALAPAAQIRLRQHSAGRRSAPPLGCFRVAIASERVTLGCRLGAARLSAADLIGLSPGDLVVLDRATDDRLPLTINGACAARGAATFDFGVEPAVVRIAEPLDLFVGNS